MKEKFIEKCHEIIEDNKEVELANAGGHVVLRAYSKKARDITGEWPYKEISFKESKEICVGANIEFYESEV